MGHRPGVKGGYFPVRQLILVRTSALKCCQSWLIWAFLLKTPHEVAPSQHELGMKFGTLLETMTTCTLQIFRSSGCTCVRALGNFPSKTDCRR